MKKLLTALFLLYASINFAQITLEHTYPNSSVEVVQTGPSTWNYYTATSSTINIYDINHNLVESANMPNVGGFTFDGVSYLNTGLFNTANNWKWVSVYVNTTNKPYEYLTILWDQTGLQLYRIDSCFGVQCFNTGSGTKMIANNYGFTKGYYAGNVYSLGGTYYASATPKVSNGSDAETAMNPYPNPSNNMIHLTYNLPSGSDKAEMVITNLSGQVVKTCNVGNAFNDILLDTKQYAPGEYFYYVHTGNYTSATSKFIISR